MTDSAETTLNMTNLTLHGAALYNNSGMANLQNLSLNETLKMFLGPQKQDDQVLLMFFTVFYVFVFISGLLGNMSVIIVIVRSKGLHCAMNYYLISLAIADVLIILLGVPNELAYYWHQYPYPFGEYFCKIRTLLSEGASYASVLTILSFSLERYLAICTPLYIFPGSDVTRAVLVSLCCWLVALVSSIPYFLFTKLNYIDYPFNSGNPAPQSAFCAMLDVNIYPKWYPVHEMSFLVFFLIPITLLIFFYTRMILTIRRASKSVVRRSAYRGSNKTGRSTSVKPPPDNRKQTIRMLVSVVILFFIAWSPFHFQRLGYVYFKNSENFRTVNQYVMYFSGFLYYLSSTLNPLLYTLLSAKYRESFKKVILCRNSSSGYMSTRTMESHLSMDKSIRMRSLENKNVNNNQNIYSQTPALT